MLPPAARDFYALQQRVNKTARNEVRRLWRRMGSDFDSSWGQIAPAIFATISEAQLVVAEHSVPYLKELADQTTETTVEGELVPRSLAGVASDGRPLDSLAYGAVVRSGEAFNAGATQTQALKAGGAWLDMMTALQVADTARVATSIGAQVRPEWSGYVRYLNPPSCQRCAVLAGRVYRHSTGFQRHPRCDCMMVPCKDAAWAEAEGFIGNPDDAWRQGHIKDLTKGQQQALEDGADISQVVNAKRGMTTTVIGGRKVKVTSEGTTRRGVAFRGRTGRNMSARLTPESIYRIADDQADRIRMLRLHGYVL